MLIHFQSQNIWMATDRFRQIEVTSWLRRPWHELKCTQFNKKMVEKTIIPYEDLSPTRSPKRRNCHMSPVSIFRYSPTGSQKIQIVKWARTVLEIKRKFFEVFKIPLRKESHCSAPLQHLQSWENPESLKSVSGTMILFRNNDIANLGTKVEWSIPLWHFAQRRPFPYKNLRKKNCSSHQGLEK